MTSVFSPKDEVRAWAKARLFSFTAKELSDKGLRLVSKLENYIRNSSGVSKIFLFASLPYELNVLGLSKSLTKVQFALPRINDDGTMTFHQFVDGDDLAIKRWGLREPVASACILEPRQEDLMLVPCLAISRKGDRLGHGKGYYDRYLGHLASRPKLIGICPSELVLSPCPWELQSHDIPMDNLCTEDELIPNCRNI